MQGFALSLSLPSQILSLSLKFSYFPKISNLSCVFLTQFHQFFPRAQSTATHFPDPTARLWLSLLFLTLSLLAFHSCNLCVSSLVLLLWTEFLCYTSMLVWLLHSSIHNSSCSQYFSTTDPAYLNMFSLTDKNEPSRFLGEGVSYKAKLIGILEVSDPRGDRMCQEALADLKMAIRAAGEHKQRITINIAIDGLRLRDEKTQVTPPCAFSK